MNTYDFLVIGGGAAGFFGAISAAESERDLKVLILEATPRVLSKVKVSGGGRCNVTHNCFDPKQLVRFYPRGQKELLGPFSKFGPKDTIKWFADHGVELKVEADNRMFPTTDSSETIIQCLSSAAQKAGVELRTKALVETVQALESGFEIRLKGGELVRTKTLLLATGSAAFGIELAKSLGHTLVEPNPSLFTFEIDHPLLKELPGVSFPLVSAELQTPSEKFIQEGPMLITHWGLSGPAVLRLSAFAARALFACDYKAKLFVNFEGRMKLDAFIETLTGLKSSDSKKKLSNLNPLTAPKRFWETLLEVAEVSPEKLWADLSKKEIQRIAELVIRCPLQVVGKGAFKEEFVTAGGISRSEIDFRSFQSKKIPGLFMAGEVIDVDGVTGGFNFQNAWTGSYLAGRAAAEMIRSEQ